MTEAEAYRAQAQSDFSVFEVLLSLGQPRVPESHILHYLQMTTEKIAKAVFIASCDQSFDRYSHVAFSKLAPLLRRKDVARRLGYSDYPRFAAFLRHAQPILRAIDELHPSVGPQAQGGGAKNGPNCEYPWSARAADGNLAWHVPAQHDFGLLVRLRTGAGPLVVALIRQLLARADALFAD